LQSVGRVAESEEKGASNDGIHVGGRGKFSGLW
jgi:hypothetical protein